MSNQAWFLFNPYSNAGRASRKEARLKSEIEAGWPGSELIVTEPGDQFWADIRSKVRKDDLLVACGGDGTVHMAGNLAAEEELILGVIPLGSGNDFARMAGIPQNLKGAIETLRAGNIRPTDTIKLSGDFECRCLNTVGIGLDGLANRYTKVYKEKVGQAGYIAGALKSVMKTTPFNVKITSGNGIVANENVLMLTACNGFREGGRFIVAPDAISDDGELDLLIVSAMNKLKLLLALPQFLLFFPGYIKQLRHEKLSEVTLELDREQVIHVDGEYSDFSVKKLHMRVESGKIRVIC